MSMTYFSIALAGRWRNLQLSWQDAAARVHPHKQWEIERHRDKIWIQGGERPMFVCLYVAINLRLLAG